MREVDILMDLLSYMETSQVLYNENIIEIRNPEARQLFTLLRDDEMRAVEMLQQKIERFESEKGIIAKMFPNRKRL
jgi:rubrerythrin